MAFSISSVTDAGRTAMQIALDNDYPLIFTALRSGNGSYTEGEDVTSRTALKSLKNSFAIGSREDLDHSVKLGAVLTNYDGTSTIVSESYNVNEIGLFCTVNNIEYLYALAAAPDDSGRELPAYDGTNLTQIVQTWTVALTNDAEIQVEMSGAYALAADLTTEIANRKVADSKDNTVTYTSADDVSIFNSGDLGGDSDYAWAPVAKIDSAEKHSVLFNKVSTMFKNIRTIAKLIGTTDISAVGDGTVSGAVSKISSDLSELLLGDGAGIHNAIYRGKYLGDTFTAEQSQAIQDGSFHDLYIGDYWTIGGVNWRIAHFDYWLRTGSTEQTNHHVVIVPDENLYNAQMNTSKVTTGGYIGSAMYTANLASAKATVNSAFGSAHVLPIKKYLTNSVSTNIVNNWSEVEETVGLMNESMVYGAPINSKPVADSINFNVGYEKTQLALFKLRPELITNRGNWWLRCVVSAEHFANVNSIGHASHATASNSLGVRPAFAIY